MPNKQVHTASHATSASKMSSDGSELMTLFINSLKDINWAEKQLLKSLKTMIKASGSPELKAAFEKHLAQTQEHITRLEEIFSSVNHKVGTKKCLAMAGLVAEAEELIEETEKGSGVRDAALIMGAQKVEHYEIATYGTLKTLAGVMKLTKVQQLLEKTLTEEKDTDALLTKIAENYVNMNAMEE